MKIYNSQLVMGLVYRSTLELLQSTLQVYVTTMAWYREIHVWVPSWLASCVVCCKKQNKKKNQTKKDNRACVLHYCQDKIQERQSKGGFKDTTYKY